MASFQQKLFLAILTSIFSLGFIEANPVQAASLRLGIEENLPSYYLGGQKNSQLALSELAIKRREAAAKKINSNIENRYQSLIEEDTENISLFESQKLSRDLIMCEEEITQANLYGISIIDLLQKEPAQEYIPKSLVYTLIALIGIFGIPSIGFLAKSYVWGENGVLEKIRNKYGKSTIPEGIIFLHNRSLKELEKISKQAEAIDDKKFSNQEFLLFLKLKQAMKLGTKDSDKLAYSSELLRVAIATQSSFLKIEQTELRFRSRKQQEFYQFVVESIEQEFDTNKFRDKVKRKLAEIAPLLNSSEGRQALQSYLHEIDVISEHEIGLKLFSLFKQYQLADFTVLKKVSDIVDFLKSQDLLQTNSLIGLIIANYDDFEKIGPIIGISKAESLPETYAKIVQYLGLYHKYKNHHIQFKKLLKILEKYQKPYKSVISIREQYKSGEHRLTPEFSQQIPGLNIYHKYEKYIEINN
jgi:hypothetical protein